MTTDALRPFKAHDQYFEQQIPTWLSHSSTHAIKELHQRQLPPAQVAADTVSQLRDAFNDSLRRSQASNAAAARVLRTVKGISEFAEPLLRAELKRRFSLDISVTANELVHMRNDASWREDRLASVLISRQPLLQAALQNFSAGDVEVFRTDAYSAVTAFGALQPFPEAVDPARRAHQSIRYSSKLSISPHQFAQMCRELDIGQQYQDHLQAIFDAPNTRDAVRQTLVAAARDLCETSIHAARVAGHISEPAYRMLKKLLAQSATSPASRTLRVDKVYEYGKSAFDGSRCYLLNLFGTTLGAGFLLIGPDPASAQSSVPLVVLMPGAAKPVQEYDSYADFYLSLKARLLNQDFRRFFSRFLGWRGQSKVFGQLTSPSSWQAQKPRAQGARCGGRGRGYSVEPAAGDRPAGGRRTTGGRGPFVAARPWPLPAQRRGAAGKRCRSTGHLPGRWQALYPHRGQTVRNHPGFEPGQMADQASRRSPGLSACARA
ncbi:DUF6543 domain-containing protein [Pseudomonas sp. RC2C2]|uniref:dermonecrotic toxin domain-containing protein n=1 Tax=Pseudomonas sp. RC2C2 TaxID=2834408 RepID=UPI001BCE920B|nr:DUF6543 domain-containing protein [Pseudomonas sp. RC2C2]MBS7601504.1 hypothetical protein [Pseudomonas sp. RC2C2]